MNILAHAYLAGNDEGLIIGNFIADFIKGHPEQPRHGLSKGVQRGVWLHRAIDTYTDMHPVVEGLRQVVRPRCHKYAGVAIDVFLDHFLAQHFTEIAGLSLTPFAQSFYRLIEQNEDQLPAGARRMAGYMIEQDWLTSYGTLEGIERSLRGIARRTAFPSNLDGAIADLTTHYRTFDAGFARFFPQLQRYVAGWPDQTT